MRRTEFGYERHSGIVSESGRLLITARPGLMIGLLWNLLPYKPGEAE